MERDIKGRFAKDYKLTKEEKLKKSLDTTGEGNSFYGKKHSEATKLKMSLNHADVSGKNNGFYGKKHSANTIEKLRLDKLGERGADTSHWKGGKHKDKDGYIYIYSLDHPFKNKQGYVFEHRLVMEQFLGRYLQSVEVVHHEGEKDDNRIEKLKLFANSVEHQKYHRLLKKLIA